MQSPPSALKALAATLKARWVCEQAHQQLKEELGLDHFEGRSWAGLHRHALMSLIAFLYLQHRTASGRQAGEKRRPARRLSRACRRSGPLSSRSCVPTPADDVRSGDTSRRHKVICQGSASSTSVLVAVMYWQRPYRHEWYVSKCDGNSDRRTRVT